MASLQYRQRSVLTSSTTAFTVGIAYFARWFPMNRHGFAMRIVGVGNTGAAVTRLVAPTIVVLYGFDIRIAALLTACFSLPGGIRV